jgi:hypothetical protein
MCVTAIRIRRYRNKAALTHCYRVVKLRLAAQGRLAVKRPTVATRWPAAIRFISALALLAGIAVAHAAPNIAGVWQVRGTSGALPDPAHLPPFTPAGARAYAKNREALARGDASVDLTSRCSSPGAPRIMLLPYPFEILQQPDHIAIVFEWNQVFRQIVMSGKRDPYTLPSAMGFSAGHWDGDTLVVTTTDRNGQTFLDNSGLPHGEKLKLTERFHLEDRGNVLVDRLTIEDPDTYTKPWSVALAFERKSNTQLAQDVCLDRVAAGLPAIQTPAERSASPEVADWTTQLRASESQPRSVALIAGTRGGQDVFGPYEVVRGWPKDIASVPGNSAWTYGAAQSVFAETPDRVLMLYRGELPNIERPTAQLLSSVAPSIQFPVGRLPWRDATVASLPGANAAGAEPGAPTDGWSGVVGVDAKWENCIVVANANGDIIERWTQWDGILQRPHFIAINPYDPEKHVWVVDDNLHVVYEFTHDGSRLVQTLGTPRVKGADATHFNRPTFLAWLPDSTLFVADGYNGTRVAKFDKDGHFLLAWGEKGVPPDEKRPGYMNNVHGLAIDPQTRRVFVNDRANHRIQVFDENGGYLYEWSAGGEPSDIHLIYIGADRSLWAADRGTSKLLKYDLEGHFLYSWGVWGDFPGGFWGVHGLSVDSEGNLYVAEVDNGRVQKLRPREGVDPAFLVSRPVAP